MKEYMPASIPEELWESIEALDTALDERDQYTRNHSHRLLQLTTRTAMACNLEEHELQLLQLAATLHDLGKIGIPDHILCKPEKLDPEEWLTMKTHSTKGERIVNKMHFKHGPEVAKIVRHHHEQFNGSGYPDGLKSEDIPWLSRIISVCDSYDAMTTTRVYARARTHTEAMEILYSEEGEKSDPYIFRKFIDVIGNGTTLQ